MFEYVKAMLASQAVINAIGALAGLATISAVIYGFWWLRNYKIQKRVEFLGADAKEALMYVTDIEEAIKKLFLLTSDKNYAMKQEKHIEVQCELSLALNRLRNMLLAMSKNEHLKDSDQLLQLIRWIERLGRVLVHKKPLTAVIISIDLLSECDLLDKEPFSIEPLEKLRIILCNIREVNI